MQTASSVRDMTAPDQTMPPVLAAQQRDHDSDALQHTKARRDMRRRR